ncbi:MAG: hypothetical protein HUJ86_02680 [Synergistes sp.]|nr:hypothetical protein [Synergistes sp.]
MITEQLKEILRERMLTNVRLGIYEPEACSCCYDENGWYIEVFYECQIIDCASEGDGYNIPSSISPTLTDGEVTGIDICFRDEIDEEVPVPQEEINALEKWLQRELELYLSRI